MVFRPVSQNTTREYFWDFPIQPPYSAEEVRNATVLGEHPDWPGLLLGWKLQEISFVDGLGRDLRLDCPTLTLLAGNNPTDLPQTLYVSVSFLSKSGCLFSSQSHRELVSPKAQISIPNLWARFPFSISELARTRGSLVFGPVSELHPQSPRVQHPFRRKIPRLQFGNLPDGRTYTRLVVDWVPGSGNNLLISEPLTPRNQLRVFLEKVGTTEAPMLHLRTEQSPKPGARLWDNLVYYALWDGEGQLYHSGSCQGLGNWGIPGTQFPILPHHLSRPGYVLELWAWEGPVGSL